MVTVGLLDRASRDVDDGPALPVVEPSRIGQFAAHGAGFDIVALAVLLQHDHAVPAHLHEPVGALVERDDQRAARIEQLRGRRDAGHDRDIGRLDPAIGEIEAGRRLGRARHPDDDDIGVVEILRRLTVVVAQHELDGVDPREVIGVERMLTAGLPGDRARAEIARQRREDRFEHRNAGHADSLTALGELSAPVGIDQRVDHDAGAGLDLVEDIVHLALGSNQRPDMFFRLDAVELDDGRPGNRANGLAGGVRDEMQVKTCSRPCEWSGDERLDRGLHRKVRQTVSRTSGVHQAPVHREPAGHGHVWMVRTRIRVSTVHSRSVHRPAGRATRPHDATSTGISVVGAVDVSGMRNPVDRSVKDGLSTYMLAITTTTFSCLFLEKQMKGAVAQGPCILVGSTHDDPRHEQPPAARAERRNRDAASCLADAPGPDATCPSTANCAPASTTS